jgi:glycosyltransferase involved in cell wall biosynthesis
MITYNHAPYIAKAIDGVLQQETTFPIELVIGEDCSTDGTREAVLEYQRRHPGIITVVTSDKNVGAKSNSYRTVKGCRGKYLAFCDGDDFWHHPHKLQQQADYLESHPDCGLVFSDYDVFHVGSGRLIANYLRRRNWEMPQHDDLLAFFSVPYPVILTCTAMTRRAAADQIIESDPYLYQGETFLMGDSQLWLETAVAARVHYIAESLATHNITDESATRGKDPKKSLRFGMSNAELFLYLSDKYGLPREFQRMQAATWCDCSLRLALESRDPELAEEARRRAKTLTWKQWFRYHGARHSAIYHAYRIAASLRRVVWNERDPWE